MLKVFLVSVVINVILVLILFKIKKKQKEEQNNREKLECLSEELLRKQIEIMSQGDDRDCSIKIEIAKFVKDYLLKAMIEGKYSGVWKKCVHRNVVKEYPELFDEL